MGHPHGQIYAFPFIAPRLEQMVNTLAHLGSVRGVNGRGGRRSCIPDARQLFSLAGGDARLVLR